MITFESYCKNRFKNAKSKYGTSGLDLDNFDFYEIAGYYIKRYEAGIRDNNIAFKDFFNEIRSTLKGKRPNKDVDLIMDIIFEIKINGKSANVFEEPDSDTFKIVNGVYKRHPIRGGDFMSLITSCTEDDVYHPCKYYIDSHKFNISRKSFYYIKYNKRDNEYFITRYKHPKVKQVLEVGA